MRVLLIIVITVIPALMVSTDSLWIDEAFSAYYATQPNIQSWCHAMSESLGSEVQMPLSMFLAYIWGHLVGTHEWQLRLPNVLYAWCALCAMWLIGRRQNLIWLPLFFVVMPFLGFYINEGRPYVLIIACASWILYGFLKLMGSNGQDSLALCIVFIAGILLCAAHMLGLFLLGVVFVVILWHFWLHWNITRKQRLILTISTLCMILITAYYLATILRGAGGAKLWSVSIVNILFAGYEILGLSAFGPPRPILRETVSVNPAMMSIFATFATYWLAILFVSTLYGMVVFKMLRRSKVKNGTDAVIKSEMHLQQYPGRAECGVAVIICLTVSLLFLAAWLFKWPFWGRHLALIYPFFIYLIIAQGHDVLWQIDSPGGLELTSNVAASVSYKEECGTTSVNSHHKPFYGQSLKPLGIVLILTLLLGAMNQRYNKIYARDDYRSACRFATQAINKKQTVWWAANVIAAKYYGVVPEYNSENLISINNLHSKALEALPTPDMIIFSKADIYDSTGGLKSYIENHKFKRSVVLPAFTIWVAPRADELL